MTLRMSVPYFLQGYIPWGIRATPEKVLSHLIPLLVRRGALDSSFRDLV